MKQKILLLLALIVIIAQGLKAEVIPSNTSPQGEAIMLQGDVNGDGIVNIGDVTTLISMLLDGDHSTNADVDGNGRLSINDVTALIDLLLGAPTTMLYSTVLVTTNDGITLEYLLDENSRLMIAKPDFIIETDGMVMTYGLANMAQLSYGLRTVTLDKSTTPKHDVPTAGTILLHDLKENAVTEVVNADGNVVMSQQGNDNVKVSLGNQPAGEYVIKADSQTIKIFKP